MKIAGLWKGIVIGLACSFLVGTSLCAFAQDNDFTINAGTATTAEQNGNTSDSSLQDILDSGEVKDDDIAMGDFIKNYRGVTSSQLSEADNLISPLTNFLGFVSGILISLATAGIFFITAIDIAYIAIPPVRGLLYPQGANGGAMGGGMGYNNQNNQRKYQLISDEAIACTAMMSGGQRGSAMGMQQAGQNNQTRGSVIKIYLGKRIIFIIFFAICLLILTSSALLGTGVNLAMWGLKLIDALNTFIGNF